MRKLITLSISLLALAAVVLPTAAMAKGVERVQCEITPATVTFTVLQPKDVVGQFDNVWRHEFEVTLNANSNTFGGRSKVYAPDNTLTWEEEVTGSFNDAKTAVSFETAPVGGGATFKVVEAPMDNRTVTAESTWTQNIIEFRISPVVVIPGTTSDYKNHGDYVSSNGGGADAAHDSCGMPVNSTKNKTK